MGNVSGYRYEWLKAVNRTKLLPRAKVVATALALEFFNEETGQLNPGIEKIATASGSAIDTVKRGIRDLIEGGWLARTEGRGAGNKTVYTFLSPGKIIALQTAKKGADMPQEKGGTHAPLDEKKGAPVRGKGGTHALSYNNDKQSLNNKAGAPDANRWKKHRFTGNAWDGPRLIPADSQDALSDWGRWLKSHGLPALYSIPIQITTEKGSKIFLLPWQSPPDDERRTAEALAYFNDLIEPEEVRYAAQ